MTQIRKMVVRVGCMSRREDIRSHTQKRGRKLLGLREVHVKVFHVNRKQDTDMHIHRHIQGVVDGVLRQCVQFLFGMLSIFLENKEKGCCHGR